MSATAADPSPVDSAVARRHDLDALRAAAMLLGIAYHAALSFSLGAGWMVQDVRQSKVLYVFQAFVHGFRMQLFMVLSGFFTAMLWRKKGLKVLLKNRFRKILLPCLAGLLTVVPAIEGAGRFAAWLRNPQMERTPARFTASLLPGESPSAPVASFAEPWSTPDFFSKPQTGLKAPLIFTGTLFEQNPSLSPTPRQTQTPFRWVDKPVFPLVWFLWFLVWFTPLLLFYAVAAERRGWRLPPHPLILTQRSLLWLVPLTAIPGWFMKSAHGEFGPDTSLGLLPTPHVYLYYAVFFGFGALYFESNDATGRLGWAWRWSFPAGVLVVLPLALEFAAGTFGLRDRLLPAAFHRPASVFLQALYAWMMTFACIGMFRSLPAAENKTIRYLSDASYWLYLAHLPVVILLQAAVYQWPLPALVKFCGICVAVTTAMLASYEILVRRTVVGVFLTGTWLRRRRHADTHD